MTETDSAKAAEGLAQRASEAMHAKDFAAQAMGISVTRVAPGEAELTMTVRDDMLNGHAVCHGGFLFSLADTAFAHACNSRNRVSVATSAAIEFLRPARADDVLTALARERSRGRRTGVYDVEVRNGAGDLLALFRGKSFATGDALVDEGQPGD